MIKNILKDYSKNNKSLISTYVFVILLGIITSFFILPKYTANLMSSIRSGKVDKSILYSIVCAFSFVVITDMTKRYLEDTMVPDFTKVVRATVYKYVINSHKSDRQIEIGKLLNIMSYLPYTIRSSVLDILRIYIPHYAALIVLAIYFFMLNIKIGYLQLITLIMYVIIILFNITNCVDASYTSMKDYLRLSENIKDKVSNIGSIYASQQENAEINQYDTLNNINANIYRKSLRETWKLRLYEEILILCSFVVFNYIIVTTKIPTKIKISLFVAEIYYFMRMIQASQRDIVRLMVHIGEGKAMIEYLNNLFQEKKTPIMKHVVSKSSREIALEIQNLYFKYTKSSPYIYKNLQLTAYHGDKIWIKGNSGCGKSTLFNIILGGLTPNKGSIAVYGQNDKIAIRNNISVVNQHAKLFNESVLNNILYGNNATEKDVNGLLKSLDTNIYNKLSKGLHTNVGIDGDKLSGGQKSLTVLLRCYFRPSKLVLFDEPIASIDEENVPLILKMISLIAQNRTILIISHNDRVRSIVNKELQIC